MLNSYMFIWHRSFKYGQCAWYSHTYVHFQSKYNTFFIVMVLFVHIYFVNYFNSTKMNRKGVNDWNKSFRGVFGIILMFINMLPGIPPVSCSSCAPDYEKMKYEMWRSHYVEFIREHRDNKLFTVDIQTTFVIDIENLMSNGMIIDNLTVSMSGWLIICRLIMT